MPQVVLIRKIIVNLKMVQIKKNSSNNAARTIAAIRSLQAKKTNCKKETVSLKIKSVKI